MLMRRQVQSAVLAFGLAMAVPAAAAGAAEPEPEPGDNGLYSQDWFLDSFLEMKDDLEEAAGEGKRFAVIWEQRGCPYCRELHLVNFARPDIRDFVRDNFVMVQLDLWGSREVTDFDGEALEEREMARKWHVNFTPTIMFFPDDPAAVAGKPAQAAEIARMPGYFKPFHFLSMFEYVRLGHYKTAGFQAYLRQKFADLEAKGIDPEVW